MLTTLVRRSFAATANAVPKDLAALGIRNANIYRNLSVPALYELGLQDRPADVDTRQSTISDTGAFCAYSGVKMGRSPKDKRVVKDEHTANEVWWGDVNIPLEPTSYAKNEERVLDYLNNKKRLYVVDGYAGWDPKYRLKITVVCSRAYHALFMRNMLIRATPEELERDFKTGADFTVLNGGEFPASKLVPGVTTKASMAVNFTQKKLAILGSQYAGEMKKGVFSVMHYLLPPKGVVTLHASANEGKKGDTTLLFGLSGTGKTTLSADPRRALIGDDEHCWSDDGIFNIEGGCYAKCINLTREKEPEIFDAIRFGSILENVIIDPKSRKVNYDATDLTENTRATYPLEYIPGAKFPAIGGHPKNMFFLTCDAWGVLPPVSQLTFDQAMYHFISGYTAKVAGTEVGITDPVATFSACFGEAFLTRHPTLYAQMLAEKMKKYGTKAWLINTGWSGGKYGVGKRMSLKYTRAIIDAIHDGHADKATYEQFPVFNVKIPTALPGVPTEILNPRNTWTDKADFDKTLKKLGESFAKNFKKYEDKPISQQIKQAGGPQL
jgi:phosphoenolpyruvate carboxykinase (ATP)